MINVNRAVGGIRLLGMACCGPAVHADVAAAARTGGDNKSEKSESVNGNFPVKKKDKK